MLHINKLLPGGRGLAPVLVKRAATVELDWDVRQKSRFDATDSQGRSLGVFLPRGTVVRGGDVLVLEDGSFVLVKAAHQPVLRVQACTEHGTPFDLMRAAYHLGNRHVSLELQPDHLKLEPDHVLAGMLRQMDLIVTEASETFEPESGAYASGHGSQAHAHAGHDHAPPAPAAASADKHGHGHGHGQHGQGDHQGHGRGHGHDHGHDHDHDHGHDHGHGHGQDRDSHGGARGEGHGHGH